MYEYHMWASTTVFSELTVVAATDDHRHPPRHEHPLDDTPMRQPELPPEGLGAPERDGPPRDLHGPVVGAPPPGQHTPVRHEGHAVAGRHEPTQVPLVFDALFNTSSTAKKGERGRHVMGEGR